jgi:hypothetical protein
MQYSPKLKIAMDEIKQILKKHDIAGVVAIHNIEGLPQRDKQGFTHVQGFGEFLFHINPSYSAANFDQGRLKVLGKAMHYPSKDARDTQLANTVNMLENLGTITGNLSLQLFEITNMVKMMVEEKKNDKDDSGFTSNEEQNN